MVIAVFVMDIQYNIDIFLGANPASDKSSNIASDFS